MGDLIVTLKGGSVKTFEGVTLDSVGPDWVVVSEGRTILYFNRDEITRFVFRRQEETGG